MIYTTHLAVRETSYWRKCFSGFHLHARDIRDSIASVNELIAEQMKRRHDRWIPIGMSTVQSNIFCGNISFNESRGERDGTNDVYFISISCAKTE